MINEINKMSLAERDREIDRLIVSDLVLKRI